MKKHIIHSSLIGCCITSSLAHAGFQSIGQPENWLLGGLVNTETVPYQQADAFDLSLQPYLAYEWEHLHLGVDGAFYEFYQMGDWRLTLDAKPRSAPYKTSDSKMLAGLERSSALDLGVSANYILANNMMTQWYWEGQYLKDISGTYHGDSLSTSLGFQKVYARHLIDVSFGVNNNSAKLNQYSYGVSAQEAREDRPAYRPQASFQPYMEVDLHYELSDSSLLVTQVSVEYFSAEMRESPIIDQKLQASVLVGWIGFF